MKTRHKTGNTCAGTYASTHILTMLRHVLSSDTSFLNFVIWETYVEHNLITFCEVYEICMGDVSVSKHKCNSYFFLVLLTHDPEVFYCTNIQKIFFAVEICIVFYFITFLLINVGYIIIPNFRLIWLNRSNNLQLAFWLFIQKYIFFVSKFHMSHSKF